MNSSRGADLELWINHEGPSGGSINDGAVLNAECITLQPLCLPDGLQAAQTCFVTEAPHSYRGEDRQRSSEGKV